MNGLSTERRQKQAVGLACLLAASMLTAVCADDGEPGTTSWPDGNDDDVYQPPDELKITFYDVGQGDAALLRFPGGSTMLVDGGPNGAGAAAIVPNLRELGLDYLDIMVVTHPDADHCGGLDEVLAAVAIGELWENGETKDTTAWDAFSDAVDASGAPRCTVSRGDEHTIDGCRILVLNADEGWSDVNANSVVLSIDCAGITLLLTGDITAEAQDDLIAVYDDDLAADAVKVPHHGSANRAATFPGYVKPEVAVVSCGADNPYGHPDAATVAEWEAAGATTYRTDRDGPVVVTAREGSISVEQEP